MRYRGSLWKLPTIYPPDTHTDRAGQGTIQGTGDAMVPFVSVQLSEHVKSPVLRRAAGAVPFVSHTETHAQSSMQASRAIRGKLLLPENQPITFS